MLPREARRLRRLYAEPDVRLFTESVLSTDFLDAAPTQERYQRLLLESAQKRLDAVARTLNIIIPPADLLCSKPSANVVPDLAQDDAGEGWGDDLDIDLPGAAVPRSVSVASGLAGTTSGESGSSGAASTSTAADVELFRTLSQAVKQQSERLTLWTELVGTTSPLWSRFRGLDEEELLELMVRQSEVAAVRKIISDGGNGEGHVLLALSKMSPMAPIDQWREALPELLGTVDEKSQTECLLMHALRAVEANLFGLAREWIR